MFKLGSVETFKFILIKYFLKVKLSKNVLLFDAPGWSEIVEHIQLSVAYIELENYFDIYLRFLALTAPLSLGCALHSLLLYLHNSNLNLFK